MELFEDLQSLEKHLAAAPSHPGTAVTIGVFDGLHQGHQALITRAVQAAHAAGLQSLVITFQEHPLCTLAPPYCPKRILDRDRKHVLLAEMGVDLVADIPFTDEFAHTPPEEFVRQIVAGLCRARRVVCGYDFTFGKAGAGNIALLQQLGQELEIEVEMVEPVADHTIAVKSTMIRDLLISGEVERAARLLTRPFDLSGLVVTGLARGRTLGFPTANLDIPPSHLIPARGVYLCAAQVDNRRTPLFGAMTNIGYSPTFGPGRLSIESHLLDFEGDLVGRPLRLHFLRRLREERKFSGPGALVAQLSLDRDEAHRLLQTPELQSILHRLAGQDA